MKKLACIGVGVLLATASIAQPKVFGDTLNGQTLQWIDSALVTKDFQLVSDSNNLGHLTGWIASKPVDIWVAATPITHIAYKVIIDTYQYTEWASIKRDWEFYCAQVGELYGDAVHDYEFFHPPFKEGDGHEMFAIEKEQCAYGKFWIDGENTYTVAVEIRKYREIWITFENSAGADLYEKEAQQLQTPNDGTGNQ